MNMAGFCRYCGRQLADGETCSCMTGQSRAQQGQPQVNGQSQMQQGQPQMYGQQAKPQLQKETAWQGSQQQGQQSWQSNGYGSYTEYSGSENAAGSMGSYWESMKARMGLEDDWQGGSPYEEGKQIIPDIVAPNEGEVPIRQYEIATLRNKAFGITYASAKGRIQVTNKRILFRAAGKSIIGTRSSLQHEFLIDEIGGIEARREYIINKGDIAVSVLCALVGYVLMNFLTGALYAQDNGVLVQLMSLVFCIGLLVPFFLVKKLWLLKMLCTGGAVGTAVISVVAGGALFFVVFIGITVAVAVINALIYAIRPNLVFVVRPRNTAGPAIDIRRTGTGVGRMLQKSGEGDSDNHTGFKEIFPEPDAERAIREIGAIINDIQKFGDYGIEKWKA